MKQPAGSCRDAEARVRALTREVGSLREELRRESKRREWAVARCKEKEEEAQQSQNRVKETRYVNKKLEQELEKSHQAARISNSRNHSAIASLKQGLGEVERAVACRAAQGKQKLDVLFAGIQTLEGLLLSPSATPSCDSRLPMAVRPEVQRVLSESLCCVAAIGTLLGGSAVQTQGKEACNEIHSGSPPSGENEGSFSKASEQVENVRLRGEVSRLSAELALARESQDMGAVTEEMANRLRDYKNVVSKMQAQVRIAWRIQIRGKGDGRGNCLCLGIVDLHSIVVWDFLIRSLWWEMWNYIFGSRWGICRSGLRRVQQRKRHYERRYLRCIGCCEKAMQVNQRL